LVNPLFPRVQMVMADMFHVPVEQITEEFSPDNVEAWDSLQHLNLVLALEQEFGVQFTPEEIEQLLSAALVAELLEEKEKLCGVN
jgi:acyl carrier protein